MADTPLRARSHSSPAGAAGSGARSPSAWRTRAPTSLSSDGRRRCSTTQSERSRRPVERGLALTADLLDVAAIPALFATARDELGGFDILVTSAGVQITGPSSDVAEADWDATIDSNLKTVFFSCQAAARIFTEQGRGGKIVNLGSTFSLVGFPQFAAYNASKGGVLQLTRTLAAEWAPERINVNAIGPTAVRTEMNAYLLDDQGFLDFFVPKVPAGRVGQPDDVVGAAVFLASPASDFVHGHLLMVDGGFTVV